MNTKDRRAAKQAYNGAITAAAKSLSQAGAAVASGDLSTAEAEAAAALKAIRDAAKALASRVKAEKAGPAA